jgi:hypothetical protein
MGCRGLDLCSLKQCYVEGCCESGNEPTSCIKWRIFQEYKYWHIYIYITIKHNKLLSNTNKYYMFRSLRNIIRH